MNSNRKANRKTDSASQTCTNCVLPSSFPGVKFNNQGVCNFCLDDQGRDYQRKLKFEYRLRFEELADNCRGKNTYDILMCYSGGKDSTYTLAILKEKYHLKILAASLDNGFLPGQTTENIRQVVETLDVDHLYIKPRFKMLATIFHRCANSEVFPIKLLERSSAVCTACMGIIKYYALRLAIEMGIPLIAYGWSPGQAPITASLNANNPAMVKVMQRRIYEPLSQIVGNQIQPYFLEEKHFMANVPFPYNVNPLAFLDYDIDTIYKTIISFGWKKPAEVDANSTNCLLNALGNYCHTKRLGFHPYTFELANLVREGQLSRPIALQRLQDPDDSRALDRIKERLEKALR
jgi:hypothetical protein